METCIYSQLTKPANATDEGINLYILLRHKQEDFSHEDMQVSLCMVEKDDIIHMKQVTSSLRIVTVTISERETSPSSTSIFKVWADKDIHNNMAENDY